MIRVLVGLLMQYPSGGIKNIPIGRKSFALLLRYERGLWRIQETVTEWNWLCGGGHCGSTNQVSSRNDLPPAWAWMSPVSLTLLKKHWMWKQRHFCRRPWTRCYRSGFQSSSSERQRERNSRSPFAAPLYFSPRQVSKPAGSFLLARQQFCTCLAFHVYPAYSFAVWRYGVHFWEENVWQSSGSLPEQLLLLPLDHNNNRTRKLTLAIVCLKLKWTSPLTYILLTFAYFGATCPTGSPDLA